MPHSSTYVVHLRTAVKECSDRGLIFAAKWASELLLSIPPHSRSTSDRPIPINSFSTSTPARGHRSPRPSLSFSAHSPNQSAVGDSLILPGSSQRHPAAPRLYEPSEDQLSAQHDLEDVERDWLASARVYVQAREFERAAYFLRDCKSPKGKFIRVYSLFMASEKKALRDWHKLDNNRNQPPVPLNTQLEQLLSLVMNETDPWLLFLKALLLSRVSRREEAIESALLSIAGFPWNWSAWTLLGSCLGDGEELSGIFPLLPLPPSHPLVQFFQVKTLNDLHHPSEVELGCTARLLSEDMFPTSTWVMSLRACSLYHLHDFARAEQQFERIMAIDPYRVDEIDVFSNILYVTGDRLKLSKLAHTFLALDKDRPEVCCLVGNHYSLRAEHEKAVKYFRRATQLDRTYLSAWTLMGHEYVEMKNSHAAIEAYRRAVDVNRKDYRAWYGLGQAYELLNMHQYALHYYQHATALRPYDVRLWQAQGMCYEEIGRTREAIDCLKRALIGADPMEITITLKLAKLQHILKQLPEAASLHQRVIDVCKNAGRPIHDYAKSCVYVAEYEMLRSNGNFAKAQEYLKEVATTNTEEVVKATEMLKTLRGMILDREFASTAGAELDPMLH